MTIIVHANDPLAYEPDALYIGRRVMRASNPIAHVESLWHNMARIGAPMASGLLLDRVGSLASFERWFWHAKDDGTPNGKRAVWCREHVHELVEATVVCWCAKPGRPITPSDPLVCHGQLLGAYANGYDPR